MKNKMALSIIGLALIVSLTGCMEKETYKDSDNVPVEVKQQSTRFQFTGEFYYIDTDKFSTVMDTKTKNLYLYNATNTYGGPRVSNLTPLYDENGEISKSK